MNRLITAGPLCALALGACATVQDPQPAALAKASSPIVAEPAISAPAISAPSISAPSISAPSISAPSISAPSISAPVVAAPAASVAQARSSSSKLSGVELAIWNSPSFQRHFTQSYLAATEIEPNVTLDEREAMQKVLALMSEDRMNEALELLEKDSGPAASAVFDFTTANIYFQTERLAEAAASYEAAVDKFSNFRRAWGNLGIIRVRQGRFGDAVEALTRVIELGGGNSVQYGLLGYSYANLGNHLAAETAYRMANLLEPETLDWQMGLASSLYRQGRFADTVSLTKTMIAGRPESADLWMLQAGAYIGLEQPLRAAENFELIDRMGQATAESLSKLGIIYVREELYDLAVDSFLRSLELGQQGGDLSEFMSAANALARRGALQESKRLIEGIETLRAEQLDENDVKELLRLRALVAVGEGAGEEEARILQEIIELDPLDGEALILLAGYRVRQGELELAAFLYERAQAIEATEAKACRGYAQLKVNQGDFAGAVTLLERSQDLDPRDHVRDYLEQIERIARTR